MNVCYMIIGNYGVTIIIFTIITKIILFPISIIVQKNSIKMVKMTPQIEKLKLLYDNKEKFMDEQIELFKKEKYHPMLNIVPLLFQLIIVMGLARVVNNPNIYIHTSDINFKFFIFNLNDIPSINNITIIMPILSVLSSWLLCYFQNKENVLQLEQGTITKFLETIFLMILSGYFVLIMPVSMGIYWICSNIFAIPIIYILNYMYNPKKHINYAELEEIKKLVKQKKEVLKTNEKREKKDYKQLFNEENLDNIKLIFYSEKSGFYKYYEAIIDNIIKNSEIVIHYITSDPDDKVFEKNNPRVIPYYISGNKLTSAFMKFEADVVVMTTPGLGEHYLKRSFARKDIEYIYIDHACVSLNLTYPAGSFDNFDTIFVSSKYQEQEVIEIEKLRETKSKNIVRYGYGLVDNMIKEYYNIKSIENKGSNVFEDSSKFVTDVAHKVEGSRNKENTILIAPSWQKDNILDTCLDKVLNKILSNNYKIIIRPHPEYIKRYPERIDNIKNKYSDKFNEKFELQLDFSSNDTVFLSDIVITDWSGIGYEFSFTTNKPTLFIDTPMKIVNKDYDKISIVPTDIYLRDKIGKRVEIEEVDNINEIIEDLIINKSQYEKSIIEITKGYLFNLGNSGEIGAKYIINKIKKGEI